MRIIGKSAFEGCENLDCVAIIRELDAISKTFYNFTNLRTVKFNKIGAIWKYVFTGTRVDRSVIVNALNLDNSKEVAGFIGREAMNDQDNANLWLEI